MVGAVLQRMVAPQSLLKGRHSLERGEIGRLKRDNERGGPRPSSIRNPPERVSQVKWTVGVSLLNPNTNSHVS